MTTRLAAGVGVVDTVVAEGVTEVGGGVTAAEVGLVEEVEEDSAAVVVVVATEWVLWDQG